jgi:hypothetical protein
MTPPAYHRARAELAIRLPERGMAEDAIENAAGGAGLFSENSKQTPRNARAGPNGAGVSIAGRYCAGFCLKKAFRDKGLMLQDTFLLITVFLDDVARLQNERNYRDAISLAFRVL